MLQPKGTEHVKELQGNDVEVRFIEGADHSYNEPTHEAKMTDAVVRRLKSGAV